MYGLLADSAGSAWTFGGSILTFLFPMLLFVGVASTLFILYTKPEVVPGHDAPEHPVSYTRFPGKPAPPGDGQAAVAEKPAADAGGSPPQADSAPPDDQEPEGGE